MIFNIVVLPEPEGPTIAVTLFLGIVKLRLFKITLSLWLKYTFLNIMGSLFRISIFDGVIISSSSWNILYILSLAPVAFCNQ